GTVQRGHRDRHLQRGPDRRRVAATRPRAPSNKRSAMASLAAKFAFPVVRGISGEGSHALPERLESRPTTPPTPGEHVASLFSLRLPDAQSQGSVAVPVPAARWPRRTVPLRSVVRARLPVRGPDPELSVAGARPDPLRRQ